ncbi:MAG: hypothetical protein ACJAT7_003736, partial [Psychromonas sp.]
CVTKKINMLAKHILQQFILHDLEQQPAFLINFLCLATIALWYHLIPFRTQK